MSRDPQLKRRRNSDIKKAYQALEAETVNGLRGIKVRKYRREAILALLSKRFYLAPDTIGDILILPDEEDDTTQLALPLEA